MPCSWDLRTQTQVPGALSRGPAWCLMASGGPAGHSGWTQHHMARTEPLDLPSFALPKHTVSLSWSCRRVMSSAATAGDMLLPGAYVTGMSCGHCLLGRAQICPGPSPRSTARCPPPVLWDGCPTLHTPRALPPAGLGPLPAGGDVLKLDKGLCSDVELIDDRVDDVGVVLQLHFHVVAVTVGDGQEDPVPDAEDFPVGSTKRLGRKEAAAAGPCPVPSAGAPPPESPRLSPRPGCTGRVPDGSQGPCAPGLALPAGAMLPLEGRRGGSVCVGRTGKQGLETPTPRVG